MKNLRRKKLLPILLIVGGFAQAISGQTLQKKLDQQTTFTPQAHSPVEQLIEVATRFQIPMGIEWLEKPDRKPATSASNRHSESNPNPNPAAGQSGQTRRVLELITSILAHSPEHHVLLEDKIVHIFSQTAVTHPFNFLNLRIETFAAQGESLYGAEANLCTAINMTLYPKLYENGWGGGYGGVSFTDPDGLFSIENLTFPTDNMTIRESLNQIARENGNSLWIVRLDPNELTGRAPHWQGKPISEYGHSPLSSRWQFYPLADLAMLATERVSVELTIEGFLTDKKFIFPVMMDHALGRKPGEGNGIFSGDGSFCRYSLAVKEVSANAVTIQVNVTLEPYGKPEARFNETIEVGRGKVAEKRMDDRIAVRVIIEARH